MKFRKVIQNKYPHITNIPSGYNRYGEIMILRSQEQLEAELGEMILKEFQWCKGVFQHISTSDENRRPVLKHLAGASKTETIHVENGVKYVIDLDKITFSGGNRHLRERLVKEVSDGECLLDMFAAIGNLSMQPHIYRNISTIFIEKDPITFTYLLKTLSINGQNHETALNKDCRNTEIVSWADRILMGYHNVDRSHLEAAVNASKTKSILHLHPLVKDNQPKEWEDRYTDWIISCGAGVKILSSTPVKSYSPGITHYEIKLEIEKITGN